MPTCCLLYITVLGRVLLLDTNGVSSSSKFLKLVLYKVTCTHIYYKYTKIQSIIFKGEIQRARDLERVKVKLEQAVRYFWEEARDGWEMEAVRDCEAYRGWKYNTWNMNLKGPKRFRDLKSLCEATTPEPMEMESLLFQESDGDTCLREILNGNYACGEGTIMDMDHALAPIVLKTGLGRPVRLIQ